MYSIIPVMSNSNVETEKTRIIKDNRGKSGIYRWNNLINSKTYLGSSANLAVRFNVYFNKNRLLGSGKRMAINLALSKYGLDKFSLDIIEYCDKDKTIQKEQYYLDLLKPEYNILKKAGSVLGFKHSLISKKLMSEKALGRVFSKETLEKMSKAGKGRKLLKSTILKIKSYRHTEEAKKKLKSVRARSVKITDIVENKITIYATMTEAATFLKTTTATIGSYLKSKKLYLKRYQITTP